MFTGKLPAKVSEPLAFKRLPARQSRGSSTQGAQWEVLPTRTVRRNNFTRISLRRQRSRRRQWCQRLQSRRRQCRALANPQGHRPSRSRRLQSRRRQWLQSRRRPSRSRQWLQSRSRQWLQNCCRSQSLGPRRSLSPRRTWSESSRAESSRTRRASDLQTLVTQPLKKNKQAA